MALVPAAAAYEGLSATDAALTAGAQLVPVMYKDAKWAARKIGTAWRKRRSNKKRKRSHNYPLSHVGEPTRNFHSKRNQVSQQDAIGLSTRTLWQNDLTQIPQAVGEATRERGLINAKGIEVAFSFKNRLDRMLFANVAIIAPKHRTSIVNNTNFFRGNGGSRGVDFGIALGALEIHYLPINTDRYNVLRHYRYQLGPDSAATTEPVNPGTGPHNFLSKKMWIRLNRQLRYDDSTSTCDTPIIFVYWFDQPSAASGSATVSNAVDVGLMHTMFFTDVV